MRFSSFICIALVLVSAAYATTDEEDINTLTQMSQNRFGNTILKTIQIHLASGDPIEDLIEMLKSVESNLQGEQKDDDAYIVGVRSDCDSTETRLKQEINAANDRVAELQLEIDEKTPIRDEKESELAEDEALAEFTEERIDDLDGEKAQQDEDWSEQQEEHDRATYVIERAKETIENGYGGSFLQKSFKPQVLTQVSEHFKSNSKAFKKNSWNKIFKLLSQITASSHIQVDAGAVQKILALIDALLEKIAESREIERREYEAWVEQYEDAKAVQLQLLARTEAEIDVLEGEIAALNKRLENAKAERDEQKERSKDKSVELGEFIKQCDDESEQYFERRQDRSDNLRTISDAVGLIESKLRILKEFVKQRLG